jgi:hypothetical protein
MRKAESYLGGHTLVPWSWFGRARHLKRQRRGEKLKHDPQRNALVSAWRSAHGARKKQLFNMILKYDRRRKRSERGYDQAVGTTR